MGQFADFVSIVGGKILALRDKRAENRQQCGIDMAHFSALWYKIQNIYLILDFKKLAKGTRISLFLVKERKKLKLLRHSPFKWENNPAVLELFIYSLWPLTVTYHGLRVYTEDF